MSHAKLDALAFAEATSDSTLKERMKRLGFVPRDMNKAEHEAFLKTKVGCVAFSRNQQGEFDSLLVPCWGGKIQPKNKAEEITKGKPGIWSAGTIFLVEKISTQT